MLEYVPASHMEEPQRECTALDQPPETSAALSGQDEHEEAMLDDRGGGTFR